MVCSTFGRECISKRKIIIVVFNAELIPDLTPYVSTYIFLFWTFLLSCSIK